MLPRLIALASGFAFAALLAAAVPVIAAEPAPVLKSVKVTLPDSDRLFPGGAEADPVNNNCLACHSAGMVLNQPAQPKAAWEAIVHKMITVYKAPIDQADVGPIVAYLARTKGTDGAP